MDGDLEHYLADGYRHLMHGGDDPAPACAKAIGARDLHAKAQALNVVKDRCHISRTRLKFIQRVLALQSIGV